MKRLLLLTLLIIPLQKNAFAQFEMGVPMESALLIGYSHYFMNIPTHFVNLGYSGFFEHESLSANTRRSRFNANLLLAPWQSLYGIQVGGSYSYVGAIGAQVNMIRVMPFTRSWRANISPFVGLDFWFASIQLGYNLQIELQPPLTPPPPPIGRLHLNINIYWPINRNKRMYR